MLKFKESNSDDFSHTVEEFKSHYAVEPITK